MRLKGTMIFLMMMALFTASLSAEQPLPPGSNPVTEQLKALSAKIEELKKQDKAILENQAKILKELDVLKVRVRRG